MTTSRKPPQERAHIRNIAGYVPGFQPGPEAIKLNTNENPFPPSPRVMARLAAVTARSLQRYPDPMAKEFREAAARLHGVNIDQIVATNGGDELLRLALSTFVDPGHAVGIVSPSYGVYSVLSALHNAPVARVPLRGDWMLADDTATIWNAAGAKLSLLTNPHAPSGALFPLADLERLAEDFAGVLLIDEAYVDFVDPDIRYDASELINRHSNVLLLRTLSKGYSLAGLRLAYGVGQTELIRPMMEKTKDSYNVDSIAQALGAVALGDTDHAGSSWHHVRHERDWLTLGLRGLGCRVAPSQANFVLATLPTTPRYKNARELHKKLEEAGIYVRWFDEERLRECLRVSVGTTSENAAFVDALRDLLT